MKMWFAGCARNCSDRLTSNVAVLLRLAEAAHVDDLKVYIAENDSTDRTRDTILSLASNDRRVVPVLLESLDDRFCTRESRIAFCRDRLLNILMLENIEGLYCPIDLDIDFSCLSDQRSFLASCQLVDSGVCTAVFPSSTPFYYDIHALRAPGWCLGSCWKEVQDSGARGATWNLLVNIRYISCRQKHYLSLQSSELALVPVLSAFGGLGVYSLGKVAEAGARYSSPALNLQDLKLCEHVLFNSYLDQLFINPSWLVSAPSEHIRFRLLPVPRQIFAIVKAALSDIKRIVQKIFK
jgi:hypothetical protein